MSNKELTMVYRQLDKDMADLHYSITCFEGEYAAKVFVPTAENVACVRDKIAKLADRVKVLPTPDPVYETIKAQFEAFVDSLGFTLDGIAASPSGIIIGMAHFIERQGRANRQSPEKKVAFIEEKINNTFAVLPEVEALVAEKTAPERFAGLKHNLGFCTEMLDYDLENLREFHKGCSEEQLQRIAAVINKIKAYYAEYSAKLPVTAEAAKAGADDLSVHCQLPEGEYKATLARLYGVDLADMESWYEEEIKVTRDEVFEIAAKLPIEEPAPTTMEEVNNILFKYSAPCKSADEMYVRATEYMKRSRAVAHEMLNLPDDEQCLAVRLPYSCKDTYPWGGYEGGDFTVQPLIGQMFLNQYNYSNITDAWIKMNTMHEAYPGHHCQSVRAVTDTIPETFKIGAKNVPLLEGTCLRTERAFEDTFPEDPFYKLHIAYRRHHTAVRILVDFTLFYLNGTIEDACNIYKEELGLDFVTARGQVRSHQVTPGYFTTYHYGMKKLAQWEKEMGLSKKDFTELLFSAGYVEINVFKKFLDLSPEDKQRYYTEFKSLYMD